MMEPPNRDFPQPEKRTNRKPMFEALGLFTIVDVIDLNGMVKFRGVIKGISIDAEGVFYNVRRMMDEGPTDVFVASWEVTPVGILDPETGATQMNG